MRSKNPRCTTKTFFAIFAALLLVSIVSTQSQAQKFEVLHTFFQLPNGANPQGGLVIDASGNFYGTTYFGGKANRKHCAWGCGTAFKLDSNGKKVWEHRFTGQNGYLPAATLMQDATGNLFGTTESGGGSCSPPWGCGTVFKLDGATGRETVLHKFGGPPSDGWYPHAQLVEDQAGNLYGTTSYGGTGCGFCGTVFKLDQKGKETVLYNFSGGTDGCQPGAGVILDSAGNLYGTTYAGGNGSCDTGDGVVFKLDTSGHETVLYSFSGPDGANPSSVLLFDSLGTLYGTTVNGGIGCHNGICGTVFELGPSGNETVLYNFSLGIGASPYGGLIQDSVGNFYGTTSVGGTFGWGTVFELSTTGSVKTLYAFQREQDGGTPMAGLTMDPSGNLYGTALRGGDDYCHGSYEGCGVVFKITP
jgi:uncharacterized repeat protein (TIGR03803 family)